MKPAHIKIKRNKEADKAAKQTIYSPRMTTTRLPYLDYVLLDHQYGQKLQVEKGVENSNSKLHYIKPRIEE